MVLVACSDNRRADAPALDMERVLGSSDSATPADWVTTYNNERHHELVVVKHAAGARWRSLCRVRGYVYTMQRGSLSSVQVSGTRCPIHSIDRVKSSGNKEVVDIVFAADFTCVKSSDDRAWKLDVKFQNSFTPMCCASKRSDFQYLAICFGDAGVLAVDVTPVSFTLIWDIPGPCRVEVDGRDGPAREICGQRCKMEVMNVRSGTEYTVRVSSDETDERCVVQVPVPGRTAKLMGEFFASRRLPDQTYDLTSVSDENIRYLRRNKVLKSGHRVSLRPAASAAPVDLLVATCGDTVELSSGKNIYVVPEFEDNESQYICLQDQLRNFMIEFDRSESFVKYNGMVYPHGATLSLDRQRVEVVQGSIILLITDSDAIDAVAFPGGEGDATTIRNSGDVIVRDIVLRDLYQVGEKVPGDTTYVSNSFFVFDSSDNSTTECSRLSAGLNDEKSAGSVSIDVLHSSSLKRTFETTAAATRFSSTNGTDNTTATFTSNGLHFDSDRGDIYFGADRDFRIHFADVDGLDPAMLQIQSLNGGEYVTRFLVTAEL